MFKPFKLFDRSGSAKSGSSLGAIGVNSKLGPSAKQYKSLIFNSSSSQFLSRTPLAAGNRKTFTWSGWVKRSKVATGTFYQLFGGGPASGANDGLFFDTGSGGIYYTHTATSPEWIVTSAVYRDPSAWYHIVLSVDTTQSIAVNRIKIYVNGVLNTDFSYQNLVALNADSAYINSTNPHRIGAHTNNSSYNFDGYLSEIYFIDGQALGPENFGYTDSIGIWQPKRYSGSYGQNGFYLPLNDSSFSELIKDKSGNGNNWALNGYSSSIISDVVVNDSPVNNFCTFDALNKGTGITLANGNLSITNVSPVNHNTVLTTIPISANMKSYMEFVVTTDGVGGWGVYTANPTVSNPQAESNSYTQQANKWWAYDNGTNFALNVEASAINYSPRIVVGDVLQMAIDYNTNRVFLGINNAWINSTNGTNGNPSTGANPTFTISNPNNFPIFPHFHSHSMFVVANFGQRPFRYTPPSGYTGISAANISVPTITNGRTAMDAISYIGGNSVYANDSFSGYLKLAMPLNANETIYDISTQLSNNISTVKVPTNSGTTFPTTSPANTKFYTGSAYFDANGTDRITIPNSNDFKFGAGDFTIECYARFESFPGTTRAIIKCADNNSWNNGWVCGFGNYSNRITFRGGGVYYEGTTTLSTGVWYHLAWTRQNGVVRQFVNGTLDKTDTVTASLDPTVELSIGNDISSNWPINGWIQDVRVYKGVAKYTSNFTPPTAMVTTENSGTTKTVTGLNFSPDLVWIKGRITAGYEHEIFDTTRGVYKYLLSNSTAAETTNTGTLTSFDSNGFQLGGGAYNNAIGQGYIAWAWDRSASKGFDIVNYVGNNAVRTISHNLGAIPRMIIFKQYNPTPSGGEGNWNVYHASLAANQVLYLDLTSAAVTNNTFTNNTRPTSSVFTVGNDNNNNKSSTDIIAYLWSEIEGYSKFGSYAGNGSADGPFVYCGFKPRYILIKNITISTAGQSDWFIVDTIRSPFNVSTIGLLANLTNAEYVGTNENIDILSNGFKHRGVSNYTNNSATNFIFAAFAEHPFKYARAR